MRGSRIFCQAGGGIEARRPENSLDNVFLVINLFYNLQSGYNGFITEGRRGSNFFQGVGVSKETHITCDFPGRGGPDPLTPLWIRTWGRLTPLFAYRIMVYQNLNKTEKYHPRRLNGKSYFLLIEIASADPEWGQGVRTPWKITSYMGFYRV